MTRLELNKYKNIEEALETVAYLKVVSLTDFGAFLDTGGEKDLFLPFAEQTDPVELGDEIIVFVYLDNNGRPCGSMRIEKHLKQIKLDPPLAVDQEVELVIFDATELGYKVIVDRRSTGLIYKNEVFQQINYGDIFRGYVKKLREDGKVDCILRAPGHEATDDIAIKILELLTKNENHLKITDKTSPEEIYKIFNASKKKFKVALGRLYKQRLVTIGDDGIRGCKSN